MGNGYETLLPAASLVATLAALLIVNSAIEINVSLFKLLSLAETLSLGVNRLLNSSKKKVKHFYSRNIDFRECGSRYNGRECCSHL